MTTALRQAPHNLEAERSVLGAMLRDATTIDEVRLIIEPSDLYSHAHQVLCGTIWKLAERQAISSIDLVTLGNALAEARQIESIGGYGYLAKVYEDCPTAANAAYYARIVKDLAIRRQLIYAASDILRDAYDPPDPQELLDTCEKKILAIRERKQSNLKELRVHLDAAVDRTEQVGRGEKIGLKTGLVDLDEIVLLKPQDFVIVAARPSVGKTSLGAQVALHIAQNAAGNVFFCSVEMPGIEIAARVLSAHGDIDSSVTTGRRSPAFDESVRLAGAHADLSSLQFWLDDSPFQSVATIAANARRLHRQNKLSLIVVDYIQLLHTDRTKGQTRAESLGEVSRGLKGIARELNVPLLGLAQLNRDADGEPELHHIRESGDLEADADQVWMPWRSKDAGSEVIYLKIAKQRNGPTGQIKLFHRKEFMRFDHWMSGLQPHNHSLLGGN